MRTFAAEMINRIVAIGLLLAMVSTNLSRFFIYADFKINQDYIAAKLCENRDKPELNCKGKCILMKKLKAAEEKEKKQEQEAHKKTSVDVFLVSEPLLISFRPHACTKQRPQPVSFELSGYQLDILHPPSILS